MIEIAPARSGADVAAVQELFREYAVWLGYGLDYQDLEQEIASLPGSYSPPTGELLLARCDLQAAGCVAIHEWDGARRIAEMKRFYVRPGFRGREVGRRLVEQIIGAARVSGYRAVRLDCITERMPSALALYKRAGFREIAAYRNNPEPTTSFWELDLGTEDR